MTATAAGPAGTATVSLADPATFVHGVPYEELARRRRDEPVGWVDELEMPLRDGEGRATRRGTGYWAVTRHATIVAAERAPEIFSSAARGAFLPDPATGEDLERARQLLVNMDAPEHRRKRRLLLSAFTPPAVERLRERVERHVADVVDEVRERGEFDLVADLASEIPLRVLADVLGIPASDRGLLHRWTSNLVGFDDPELVGGDVDVYRRTFREAFQYLREILAAKRSNPADDVVSRLAAAHLDGVPVPDGELFELWILLVIAGNDTTRNLLAGGIASLVEHPDELARLSSGAVDSAVAVEELLRWVTPIMQFRRTATEDVTLDGQPVRAGDKVVLYYVSANRDESVFTAPHVLDVGRSPNPHLAFGAGPHFCLGAHLARLEAAAALTRLRPLLTRLELAGPAVRMASNFVNGVKSQPARLTG